MVATRRHQQTKEDTSASTTNVKAAHQRLYFPYTLIPWLHPIMFPESPSDDRSGYKMAWAIDMFKGATLPWCLYCVSVYNQWDNSTALAYTAAHGKT